MFRDAQAGMTVIQVSSTEADRAAVRNALAHSSWELRQVRTVGEAVLALAARPASVILCDRDAPEGGWRAVLRAAWDMPEPPAVIVTARDPDVTFWAGAIELGAYDVLWMPLNQEELFAVLQSAWRARREAARRAAKDPVPQTRAAGWV